MISREIQVSPQPLNNPLEPEGNVLNNAPNKVGLGSKVGGSSRASFTRKVQSKEAIWTHLEVETSTQPKKGGKECAKKDEQTSTGDIQENQIGQEGQRQQSGDVKGIFMQSQEVQTSMEFIEQCGKGNQRNEDQNTGSTWHADLQEINRDDTNDETSIQNKVGSVQPKVESPSHVTRKFVQQSEITTIKAAAARANHVQVNQASQNTNAPPFDRSHQQYVYQVETTSSTTEIEVSSIEPGYENRTSRSRKKKYRHGSAIDNRIPDNRKSTVAFPPSPIAKVKQVRKTLFNDNIEVIVNIKDDLLANVANIAGENTSRRDFGPSIAGFSRARDGRVDTRNTQYGNRHLDPFEDQTFGNRCNYYQQTPQGQNWQYCTGQCQSDRCHCVQVADRGNSTSDETKSSYMSPPRYVKTLHDREINNLISTHSLHGHAQQIHPQERIPQDRMEEHVTHQECLKELKESKIPREPTGQNRSRAPESTQNRVRYYDEGETDLRNDRQHDYRNEIPGNVDQYRQYSQNKAEENIPTGVKDRHGDKYAQAHEKFQYVNQEDKGIRTEHTTGKVEHTPRAPHEKIKREKPHKKPVEPIPKNSELMNYIVKLLNMDKKDISDIPIEVSDVSLASELFTSTSEASENDSDRREVNDEYTQAARTHEINENKRGKERETVRNQPSIEEETLAKNAAKIDMNSRRNQNILAQKYTDIIKDSQRPLGHPTTKDDNHRAANKICSQLKEGHYGRHTFGAGARNAHDNIGKIGDLGFVKRFCNSQESTSYKPIASGLGNLSRRPMPQGVTDLGKAIANAGSKVPYKDLFKKNQQEPTFHSKYDAIAPLLNCKDIPIHEREAYTHKHIPSYEHSEPTHNLQQSLGKKIQQQTELGGKLRQTNLDMDQPGVHKQEQLKTAGKHMKTVEDICKSTQSPSRGDKRYQVGKETSRNVGKGSQVSRQPNVINRPERSFKHVGKDDKPCERPTSSETLTKYKGPSKRFGPSGQHAYQGTRYTNHPAQTTLPSADDSTIYLNIPRRFDNVDNVGVRERLDKSLDTSDLLAATGEISRGQGPKTYDNERRTGPEPCEKAFTKGPCWDPSKWKSVKDICDGVGVSIGDRRKPSQREGELHTSGGRKGKTLNGSMDLEVPDLYLEHPLSQHTSGRKSNNSTPVEPQPNPVDWNNVDSLVQELMRRHIIDEPFPWLNHEDSERNGTMDTTELTEVLRRLLDSDPGRTTSTSCQLTETPPVSHQTNNNLPKDNRKRDINRREVDEVVENTTLTETRPELSEVNEPVPIETTNGAMGTLTGQTNGVTKGTLIGTTNEATTSSNGSALNKTTASMNQRKTDLMSIFEEYKKDIQALLNVMPNSGNTTVAPPCDIETLLKLSSDLNSTDETSSNNKDKNVTSPTTEDNITEPIAILMEDTSDTLDTSTGREDKTKEIRIKRVEKNKKRLMTVKEIMKKDLMKTLIMVAQHGKRHIENESPNENTHYESLDEDNLKIRNEERESEQVIDESGEEQFSQLAAQLSQVVKHNASLNAEWNQLLSVVASDSSSEDVERRLNRIVQCGSDANRGPDSSRSGGGWMGSTYKTIRQRQRHLTESSANSSPEEVARKPPRLRKQPRTYRSSEQQFDSITRYAPNSNDSITRSIPVESKSKGDTKRIDSLAVGEESFTDFKSLNDSVGSLLLETPGSEKVSNLNSFLRERENVLRQKNGDGVWDGKRIRQSVEHQEQFVSPRLNESHPPTSRDQQQTPENCISPTQRRNTNTSSSKKYIHSTPVKKGSTAPPTSVSPTGTKSGQTKSPPNEKQFKRRELCLCIPCTLCDLEQGASCDHAFLCKLCCLGNKQTRNHGNEPGFYGNTERYDDNRSGAQEYSHGNEETSDVLGGITSEISGIGRVPGNELRDDELREFSSLISQVGVGSSNVLNSQGGMVFSSVHTDTSLDDDVCL
ncbi:hypothetical protein WDU94_002094 [Cyamophila willieti]